ncbi:hypothetical protein [Viridibacillus arvi]|uniref:hypothetical protein n=1 Tax=Viridibacillus arvi TaxID=263475 RepID=UPI003D07BC29
MTVPLAVVGNLKQAGSVVFAANPPMKKRFGVKTGTRLYVHDFFGRLIKLALFINAYLNFSLRVKIFSGKLT